MGCRHLCPLEPLYTGVELIDQKGQTGVIRQLAEGHFSALKPTSRGVILRLRGETTSGCRPTHAPPITRNRGPRRADEIARGVADAGPAPTRGRSFPGEIGDARHVLGCHERQTAAGDGRMTTRSLWIAAGCAAVLASTQDRALW